MILPFRQERRTWNSVCSASKQFYTAGMERTPPWPVTKLNPEHVGTRSLKFSSCGSFLACGADAVPYLVSICDRRGRITRLIGHTSSIHQLSFSKDGKYLASTGAAKSVRIWPTNSTGLPQQSDKTLLGHGRAIVCMDFARGDSNILVCADSTEIKVWDVETEVCTHHFHYSGGAYRPTRLIRSMLMFVPTGNKDHKCIFVTSAGTLIRTCWGDLSGNIMSDIVDLPGLGQVRKAAFSHCGSLLAAWSYEGFQLGDGSIHVSLYDMKTMSVVRRVTMDDFTPGPHNFFTFSPNGKTLVFDFGRHEILVLQVHDLNIRRRLGQDEDAPMLPMLTSAIAFDPSFQFVASAWFDDYVRLWSL
jgi:WD40 repeat protein